MNAALRRYVKKRLKQIRKALKAVHKDADPKRIHKVRVEIKKIRAVLRLLHFGNPDFKYQSTYKPFRKVFRQCAKLRDPHVMREVSKGLTGRDFATDDTGRHLKKFRSELRNHKRNIDKQKKSILKAAKSIDGKTYRQFIRRKEARLKQMLVQEFDQTQLHNVRKIIKDILYLRQITEKSKSIPVFYEEAASILGDWHDKQILASRLRETDQSEPGLMEKLEAQSREERIRFKELVGMHYRNQAQEQ